MRTLLVLVLLLVGFGCDKTIHEVRSPVPEPPQGRLEESGVAVAGPAAIHSTNVTAGDDRRM